MHRANRCPGGVRVSVRHALVLTAVTLRVARGIAASSLHAIGIRDRYVVLEADVVDSTSWPGLLYRLGQKLSANMAKIRDLNHDAVSIRSDCLQERIPIG